MVAPIELHGDTDGAVLRHDPLCASAFWDQPHTGPSRAPREPAEPKRVYGTRIGACPLTRSARFRMTAALSTGAVIAPHALRAQTTQHAATSPRPSYGTYYRLALRIDPAHDTLTGCARIVTRRTRSEQPFILFAAPTLHVDSVTVGGAPARFTRTADTIAIPFPRARPSSATIVEVCYRAAAASPSFVRDTVLGTWTESTYGLPYSAKSWWPAPGSTSAKADSADLILTVPTPLVAVSNGRLLSARDDTPGWRTWHWATRHPIYPDVMSFAVGPYVELRDSARASAK